LFLLRREPDPSQLIPGIVDRRRYTIHRVHDVAIGGAAPVRDPGAGAGAHDRLDGRDQTTGGALDDDPVAGAYVNERLAIRHHDHVVPLQLAIQDPAQRVRRPAELFLVTQAMLGLEVVDEGAEVVGDWLQLARAGRHGVWQEAFPAHERPNALDPPAPAELGHDHGNGRHEHAEPDEEQEDIPSRIRTAALGEAHVVHEHQPSQRLRGHRHRLHRDEPRPVGLVDDAARRRVTGVDGAAVEGRRHRGRADRPRRR